MRGTAAALAAIGGVLTLAASSHAAGPRLPVAIELGRAHHADLLASGSVPVRLESPRGVRVTVAAVLRASDGQRTRLGALPKATLKPGAPRELRVPLDAPGRAALESCPSGRLELRLDDLRGRARPRTANTKLRLDAPHCGRFFASGSFWNRPLADGAPLDPQSEAVTTQLLRQIDASRRANLPPNVNTTSYTPPVVIVGRDQPRVRVQLDQPPGYAPELSEAFASVPLPATARPAAGNDRELVVWQPSTDTLWEFWQLRRDGGAWKAAWGGRLDEVSTGPAVYTGRRAHWGATASSLPLGGGLITPTELRRGRIDHALAVGIPAARRNVFARPAQRTDGDSSCASAPPEGARFRLDPALDVDSLNLPPAAKTIARAVQRYGMIVRDQSGSVSFYATGTRGMREDPYPELFGARSGFELLADFPWSRLQLMSMDLVQFGDEPLLPDLTNGCH